MRSMTAYASVHKAYQAQTVEVVLRSTNFKYLDICVHNLCAQSIELEEKIKKAIKQKIRRGKVEAYVFLKGPTTKEIKVDEQVLNSYVQQVKKLAKKYKLKADLDIAKFLDLPQVIWWQEKKVKADQMVLTAADEAIAKLINFKIREGKIIKKEMLDNIKQLKNNAVTIKKNKPKASRGDNNKEDIDEEVSLFTFYLGNLEKKVNSIKEEQKGKSIDFLTQEILRELNAASSKTRKKDIGALIVESKNYLDRVREQAQNIE